MKLKKLLFILISMLYAEIAFSQNNNIEIKADSLNNLLSNTNIVKNKIHYLSQLSNLYLKADKVLSMKYIEKMKMIAEQNDCETCMANYFHNLGIYYNTYEPSIAEQYYLKAIQYAHSLNDTTLLTGFLNNISIYYSRQGNYRKSIDYLNESLRFIEEGKKELHLTSVYVNLASLHNSIGNLDSAIYFSNKAIPLLEAKQNYQHLAFVYSNLGLIYGAKKQDTTALTYYYKAYNNFKTSGDTSFTALLFENFGNSYQKLGMKDSAEFFYLQSIKQSDIMNDIEQKTLVSFMLSAFYYEEGRYAEAAKLIEQSAKNISLINSLPRRADAYMQYSKIHFIEKNYKDGLQTTDSALQCAKNSQDYSLLAEIFDMYAKLFAATGNYELAYNALNTAGDYLDTLFISGESKMMEELKAKYESEKKQSEIDFLNQQNTIKTLDLEKSRIRQYNLLILVILLFITILFLTLFFLQRTKTNKKLALQNFKILSQNEEIKSQAEELRNVNEVLNNRNEELAQLNLTKDRFFSIISHDLKNPFHSIMFATDYIIKADSTEFDVEQLITYIKGIHQTAEASYNLLVNLLEWSRLQTGSIICNKELTPIDFIINDCMELHAEMAQNKNITIRYIQNSGENIFADNYMLNTIMRNLLSNAIKFTHNNGEIVIKTSKETNKIWIEVCDNGIGMKKDVIDKLFTYSKNQSHSGTNNEKGTGLGLLLCKEFIEKHDGKLFVESELNKGSCFKFYLPS